MSPSPRRKITGARPTAIGAKATTPSQASRVRASRNGGAASRAQAARVVDWDAVIKHFLGDMAKRASESDSERLSAPGTPAEGVSSLHGESTGQQCTTGDDDEAGE